MVERVLQANDKGIKTEISIWEGKEEKIVYKKINKRILIEALLGMVKNKQKDPTNLLAPQMETTVE